MPDRLETLQLSVSRLAAAVRALRQRIGTEEAQAVRLALRRHGLARYFRPAASTFSESA